MNWKSSSASIVRRPSALLLIYEGSTNTTISFEVEICTNISKNLDIKNISHQGKSAIIEPENFVKSNPRHSCSVDRKVLTPTIFIEKKIQ